MIKIICKQCSKFKYFFLSKIKHGRGIFCSRKCLAVWFSKNRIKENHPSWKGGLAKRECKWCKNIFFIKKNELKKGKNKGSFCSRKCMNKWQIKFNNPGYFAIHSWVRRHYTKPSFCEFCHKKGEYEGEKRKVWSIKFANKSGEYKRCKSDWLFLCQKCHIQYDRANREAKNH